MLDALVGRSHSKNRRCWRNFLSGSAWIEKVARQQFESGIAFSRCHDLPETDRAVEGERGIIGDGHGTG